MWLLIILLCLCPCFPAWAQAPPYSFTGTVSYVYDGDTILAKDSENKYHRIRLASIDAPELSQPYGNEAARLLRTLVQDETVLISVIDIDKYNREVGNVYYGCANGVGGEWRKTPKRSDPSGVSVSETMLRKGAAWHLSYFDRNSPLREFNEELEKEARLAPRGLWKDAAAIPPWQWRKLHPRE